MHSPILTDQVTWGVDHSRHLIRSANYIHRDPIFRDLFASYEGGAEPIGAATRTNGRPNRPSSGKLARVAYSFPDERVYVGLAIWRPQSYTNASAHRNQQPQRAAREISMPDFLLHISKKGGRPFQSLSDLPEEQALSIMRELYNEESIFWERFQDPEWYWRARTQIEQYLRAEFIAKGGRPKDEHPVYLVLGRPKWLDIVADPVTLATTDELRVPLSILDPHEVSFTYPDSMVSALMAVEKNPEYYEPDYHGKVRSSPRTR